MCAMFCVEHYDHLIFDYSTPHWLIFANSEFHTLREGGGRVREGEGG